MATKKKMLQAAAGQAGGAGLDITDVFSTYLYTGTGFTQTITNDIDLAGEGGLVWVKWRSGNATPGSNTDNILVDTERGTSVYLESNSTSANKTAAALSSFNSDGFTTGGALADVDNSGDKFASWTFRKAPKFFDVVTYTGDGTDDRTVSHNLGSTPGMVIVKRTSGADSWMVLHRSLSSNNLLLNLTVAASSLRIKAMDSTTFTLNTNAQVNGSGESYVAYLFAHNDGDGGFGPDGDADIIKCGSYVGNGSTDGPEIDLGFEPQWLLVKQTSTSGDDWYVVDNMRGFNVSGTTAHLNPNASAQEFTTDAIEPRATGFKLVKSYGAWNASGSTYIYMAIRRGPLAQPESGTEVFYAQASTSVDVTSSFAGDLLFTTRRNQSPQAKYMISRITGDKYLDTTASNAEASGGAGLQVWDDQTGVNLTSWWGASSDTLNYLWKRAPGFFDVVAYSGNSTAGRTVSHNLGVAPEMMWVKQRPYLSDWRVYHKDIGAANGLRINSTSGTLSATSAWNSTAPTSSVFTLGTLNDVNENSLAHIAYLFATLPGVSKVGSYTGTGATLNIDCGFTSGARFVLIKRTNNQSPWWLWDSERGIVAGNDPYLELNSTAAENTSTDYIDPYASGFALNSNGNWLYGMNYPSGEYIFYAIT
jgi:hypothetical protein